MHRGIAFALLAAGLFGTSTPFAKTLIGNVHPVVLAGLLYAGSGVGLTIVQLLRVSRRGSGPIAWPARRDWGWLAAATAVGGVVGPILLMSGLATTRASTAALLLNLESVFTAGLAWFLFQENFDRRIALGVAAILGGSVVLSVPPGPLGGASGGALLVAGACLCWAIDNNLTRKAAAGDAIVIAALKGLVAGTANLAIARGLGHALPNTGSIAAALTVGFFGYGLSLALFVLALRHLGTARTGAYFGIAPFFGAILAVILLGDPITLHLVVAGSLMAVGLWLHLTERHAHAHVHEAMTHAHAHRHDEHHRHAHDFPWDGVEPHVHPHRHEPVVHEHAHFPDLHHRHRHR